MLSFLSLTLLALTQLTSAQYNASTITNSVQLNAAISAIAASHIPTTLLPPLAIAIGSASALGTADPKALLSSLITATAPPPFLTALPTPYQSRLTAAEAQISSLRAAVESVTALPTRANGTVAGNLTLVGVTSTGSDGRKMTTTVLGVVRNGTTVTSGVIATPTTASGSGAASTAAAGNSSSSSGFAVPTHVPVAAAGLLGVLGLLVAL